MRVAAVALMFVLAACGGGGGSEEGQAPVATDTTGNTPSAPSAPALKGTPAPEALSSFRCEQDSKDRWNARGVLSNVGKVKTTFQVTVYIGQATGGEERARTTQVPSIAAGGSTKFRIKRIPAPTDGGPCHVQVLASK